MQANEQKEGATNGFWAIVEIFGHQRIAGFVSEQTIGGQSFVRVDVPEIPTGRDDYGRTNGTVAAHTKLYGGGAIYAISPVDEALARIAAGQIRHKPVETYGIEDAVRNMSPENRTRLLTSQAFGDDHGNDDAEETFR